MFKKIGEYIGDLCNIDTQLEKAQNKDIIFFCAFSQVWPSTTLGFGGVGGDSMTYAMTTIIQTEDNRYYVFFDGRLAYCVENPTEEFHKDIHKQWMKNCAEAAIAY